MHEHSFFVPSENQSNKYVFIKGNEYRHCCNVLRKNRGAEVTVFDGEGNKKKVKLIEEQDNSVKAEVLDTYPATTRPKPAINLGTGIVRNKAMKTIIDQATSLGTEKLSPLKMQNCIKYNFRRDKFVKKAIQSAKQSGNARLPKIEEPCSIEKWVQNVDDRNLKLVAYQEANSTMAEVCTAYPETDNVAVLVGPEGGIHNDELEIAKDNGFIPVNVSPFRLRAELAVTNILSGLYHLYDHN